MDNMNQKGFEPPTRSSGNCCSIQLSYWSREFKILPLSILLHFLLICKVFILVIFIFRGTSPQFSDMFFDALHCVVYFFHGIL